MGEVSPKEVYKRLLFKEKMHKKIAKAKSDLKQAQKRLNDIQDSCPHYDSFYINKGNTGSWDRDDSYWREYNCRDCGKSWTTTQSYDMHKLYPYAIDKTYER